MRFEHLIEINSPAAGLQTAVPALTREQLWQGLMQRVLMPGRFPMGPESCACVETSPGVYARTIVFGAHVMRDEVVCQPQDRVVFTPQPHGDTTPIVLTVSIEAPRPGQMVLRFVYESAQALPPEEAYFSDYRHNAWLHHDMDMVRTLRQWLTDGEL